MYLRHSLVSLCWMTTMTKSGLTTKSTQCMVDPMRKRNKPSLTLAEQVLLEEAAKKAVQTGNHTEILKEDLEELEAIQNDQQTMAALKARGYHKLKPENREDAFLSVMAERAAREQGTEDTVLWVWVPKHTRTP